MSTRRHDIDEESQESAVERFRKTVQEMSINELCDLLIEIQTKIREALRVPKTKQ